MFLYKLEVQLADKEVVLIVMGDNDEEVMREAEMNLSKHYVIPPVIREIALIEKKRANKGTAYVIEK
ncbi:DUF3906 family protein [Cohnella cholangitidis]|uniref:DUF3906 family protein n=1 Tax=Cohnella cholangitidis TaxID=2598458 RepID=A0A7G5C3S2_9BACL|nr:DUF3906 family protein [Cohnella cholangitidis]QMV43856.1 DUF3906 family protein [Cohnella cholangitidis]